MHEGSAQKLVTDGTKRIFIFILKTFAFYCVAFVLPICASPGRSGAQVNNTDGTLNKYRSYKSFYNI